MPSKLPWGTGTGPTSESCSTGAWEAEKETSSTAISSRGSSAREECWERGTSWDRTGGSEPGDGAENVTGTEQQERESMDTPAMPPYMAAVVGHPRVVEQKPGMVSNNRPRRAPGSAELKNAGARHGE